MSMPNEMERRQQIIDTALQLASKRSWHAVAMHDISNEIKLPLVQIKPLFRSKDAIAEAIFDRADDAMLALNDNPTFQQQNSQQRLLTAIITWFEALPNNKAVLKAIMAYKFEPGHIHLQAHGVTRVSRTVQWFIDIANIRQQGLKRICIEISVTASYLLSFAHFIHDKSPGHERTRHRLAKMLARIVDADTRQI
ncbi:TetR/AcrR family transcriptional regulator [Thalassotalea sp. HSM 43]|uniref:TetR/AcrR family transcriptional regulator n=1 Tax=Thalassotalea sp. HSM 43 TaxID=2552945 RepID=UPI001081799C|nr:TetR/AcrR family transcriptional regulator [Thalassotalea sp. HSM 43]QBY04664.1 TetR/AcrR family transcriptional regulator [Thalassotalea sp. HSM 43]